MLAGKQRSDGYDETQRTAAISDSSFEDGFWHPHARYPGHPPARIVAFDPDVLVQVTLQLPTAEQLAEVLTHPVER